MPNSGERVVIYRPVGGKLQLMPPAPHLCQVCGSDHGAGEAHDPTSVYYQYAFYENNGRYPSWRDSIAHLDAEHQQHWLDELAEQGLDPDAPGGRKRLDPKKGAR